MAFPYPKIAPRQRQSMLKKTRARSTAFERRLFSCSRKAPKRKLTNTLLRRVIETTAMRAPRNGECVEIEEVGCGEKQTDAYNAPVPGECCGAVSRRPPEGKVDE